MFPVADFNFVVAGIATFAATVGYACSRRLSTSLSGATADVLRETLVIEQEKSPDNILEQPLADESEATMEETPKELVPVDQNNVPIPIHTPARRSSLKRKVPHDGFDEPQKEVLGYPHNLANIYPNKRSRTPSADTESTTPHDTPSATLYPITSQVPDQGVEIPLVSSDPQPIMVTPAPEPLRTPSPTLEESTPQAPEPTSTPASPAPVIPQTPRPETPRPISPRPVTPKAFASPSSGFGSFAVTAISPRPTTPNPFASPSGGFAAFAGSSSPFASVSKPKSNWKAARSIWGSSDFTTHQNEDGSAQVLGDAFKSLSGESHALGEAKTTSLRPTEKHTHVTGEEDEDVELEQKGVKLYTKRGDKSFSEGVVGHVKLLSNRTTLEERILFRREPLWKVSMNVRVKPSVRCTYIPEENVLRLILTETSSEDLTSDESKTEAGAKQDVVVYAMKPGRSCSKQDFKDFAETLMKSSHFKASASEPSPATNAAGGAAP